MSNTSRGLRRLLFRPQSTGVRRLTALSNNQSIVDQSSFVGSTCRSSNSHRTRCFSVGYSPSWRKTDGEEEEDPTEDPSSGVPTPPDLMEYLQGFDSVPEISQNYKHQLLKACHLQPKLAMLDVGCGTGTEILKYSEAVGPQGQIVAIDHSEDMIRNIRDRWKETGTEAPKNVRLEVADAYKLPFPSHFFDVVKEDRVLEHLVRPFEATQELFRVLRPGGSLVVANPDFRSFHLDLIDDQQQQRWRESRRPPAPPKGVEANLQTLTNKLFHGVLPILAQHPNIGLQLPRLLRRVGCGNIELQVVPIPIQGRKHLENIAPISYMAELAVYLGHMTEQERDYWLERLDWEGDDDLFGIVNMYICRGIKPVFEDPEHANSSSEDNVLVPPPRIGTPLYEHRKPHKAQHEIRVRPARHKIDSADTIEAARQLINNEYGLSDSGITLSSIRLRPQDISAMVKNGELFLAEDEASGELLGCVQVLVKEQQTQSDSTGLPTTEHDQQDDAGVVGEFTCLAVASNYRTRVIHENTQKVVVQRDKDGSVKSFRGRGIGSALVRAAEAHVRQKGAKRMKLAIICPAEGPEPEYKQWLQSYYKALGYEHYATVDLDFEKDMDGRVVVDQLHAMYEPLHQLVQCKAILFHKAV